ncbi:phospholipid carrier-dependent glycosyltransferase [Acidobacteria bacterium ACD]|nr:phospholipid carrier-dependent glycosyltransferase [Acidobacteria bacterium ACD]
MGPRNRVSEAIVLSALLLKLLLLAALYPRVPGMVLAPDSPTYVRPARALLLHGTFSPSPEAAPAPEVVRTPGFPLLVAGVYAVAGERPWLVAAVNALLCAGTAILVGWIAQGLGGARAGSAAVLLFSLEPSTFHSSTTVMSEPLFTFLLCASAWVLCRPGPPLGLARALAAGAALGGATLVRPVLYPLLLPAVLAVGVGLRAARRSLPAALGVASGFALPLVVLVGGWQLRNWLRTGDATFSHVGNAALYFFRSAAVEAGREGRTLPEQQRRQGWDEFLYRFGFSGGERETFGERRSSDLHPETARLTLPQLSRLYRERALAVFRAEPARTARLHAKGLFLLWASPPTVMWAYEYGLFRPDPEVRDAYLSLWLRESVRLFWERHRALAVLSVLSVVPVAVLLVAAARGLFRCAFRRDLATHAVLLSLLVYLTAVHAGPESLDDRMRVPLVPFVAVYAGLGLAAGAGRAREPVAREGRDSG